MHEHPLGAHRIEGGVGERERLRRRDLELSPTACGGGSPASFFDHRLAGIDAYRTTRRTDDPLELEDIAGRSTPDIEHRVAGLQVEERVTGALALAEPLRGVVEVADQRSRIAARIHVRELRAYRHRGGRRPLLLGRFVTHPRAAPG